jgi:hypothetical protein
VESKRFHWPFKLASNASGGREAGSNLLVRELNYLGMTREQGVGQFNALCKGWRTTKETNAIHLNLDTERLSKGKAKLLERREPQPWSNYLTHLWINLVRKRKS